MRDIAEQIYVGEYICTCELMYIRDICSYNCKCYEIGKNRNAAQI